MPNDDLNEPTIAYLGPAGTFTESAAVQARPNARRQPYPTITAAALAQHSGQADWAVLPYENSTGGGVGETHDFLIHQPGVRIRGEITIPIEQCLILSPGAALDDVAVIYSHPQGLAQCQRNLAQHLPHARREAASSTAEAVARALAAGPQAAAVAPRRAAELHGGVVHTAGFEDTPGNKTRFLITADQQHEPTGDDRSTLFFTTANQPGALRRVLQHFEDFGINLTRLESRPVRDSWGSYLFMVDLDGHEHDPDIRDAYAALPHLRIVTAFHHLGSYPKANLR